MASLHRLASLLEGRLVQLFRFWPDADLLLAQLLERVRGPTAVVPGAHHLPGLRSGLFLSEILATQPIPHPDDRQHSARHSGLLELHMYKPAIGMT